MRVHRYLILFLLLVLLPLLACSTLTGEEATPTALAVATPEVVDTPGSTGAPEASPTPQPTETPAPSPTPEPTATAEGTSELISYTSEESGLTVQYPADWEILDFFALLIASDPELLEDTSELEIEEGAVIAIVAEDAAELPSGSPVEVLEQSLDEFDIEDLTFVEGPTATQIQGQDAAVGLLQGTADDGTPLSVITALIISGDRSALAFGATPQAGEAEYMPLLQQIVNSIVVGEPSGEALPDFPGLGDDAAGEVAPAPPGEILQGSIPDGTYQEYSFQGSAGSTVLIAVAPEEDSFDPVLSVYPVDDPDNLLVDVDDGFSGEAELVAFTPEADGEYIARVRGFASSGGPYVFVVFDAPDALEIEGAVPQGGETAVRVCVPAGQPLLALLQPLDEDFDATLALHGAGGGFLVEEVDSGFSGEPEAIVYTDAVDSTDEPYPVIVVISGFAGDGGAFTLLLGPSGVVQDGC